MALITRLSRLFQADFHAVLDRIEEPDLQLKQAVREMQFALDQDQQQSRLLQHESDQLNKSIASTEASLESFNDELDICLAAKQDDLARDLIRRQLTAEKQLQALQLQSDLVESQKQALSKQIDEQGQQLTSMKQKLELLVSTDEPFGNEHFNHASAARNEEIEIALLREKERRTRS